MTTRVLLAEDDPRIASLIERAMTASGYDVESVQDGKTALEAACSGRYALLILDRRLPGMDGLEVSRQMRLRMCRCRVLMLTALDRLQDKVDGLRGGADDYLTKPFAFDELLARVAALLRRDEPADAPRELNVDGLRIDLDQKIAWRDGRRLQLTATEYALLVVLAQQQAPCSRGRSCARRCGTDTSTRGRRSSMCTSATCARRSTPRMRR